MKEKRLQTVGWREWVALPDLGVRWIKTKIDTGARSSSIHAFNIEIFTAEDGREMVRFDIHPFQNSRRELVQAVAPLVDHRYVRSSGGHETMRPVIMTTLQMAGRRWEIELTLARRDAMGFRMLLGRTAMRRRLLVNPTRSFLTGVPPAEAMRKVPRPKGTEW